MRSLTWHYKLTIDILYNIFDFTVRRVLVLLYFFIKMPGHILLTHVWFKYLLKCTITATRNSKAKMPPLGGHFKLSEG